MKKKLLCIFIVMLMLSGCGPKAGSAPTDPALKQVDAALEQIKTLGESPDDEYRVWYEVFVYAFSDSNDDGIGDLEGLRKKLPYIQELGASGLWLMPIHPSTSYHKYNVSDYYAIDPQYGTMEDFENLMADCQKLGIRVLLDLVVNHTGYDHPWFTKAAEYLRTLGPDEEPDFAVCPEADYYFFSKTEKSGYHRLNGTDWFYESQFSTDMPDLNLGNIAVREEIRKIMKFWLDKGVAGFRLDAAKEYYSGNTEKNIEVLSFLQTTVKELKPDAYMVAEVWDSFGVITEYYKSGISGIFDYPFGNSDGKITKVIRGLGNANVVSTYATALEQADKAYLASNPNYVDAPFLSNHDTGRIAGFANRDENLMKLAGAMNLMMGGAAFVYYGEEIGMLGSGNDPSKRAPMVWAEEKTPETPDPCPECVLPESYPLGSLATQKEQATSLYNYYRQAIAIRNALPVISHGRVYAETALNQGCVSAQRKVWNDQECLILMNIDKQSASADLSAYDGWTPAAQLNVGTEQVKLEGGTLTLPAYAVAVLLPGA